MDAETYIEQLEQMLSNARPVPLSASVMVSRRDFEDLLADLRTHLPEELRRSRWVIKERDAVLEQAQREAEQVRADAQAMQEQLIRDTEVLRAAERAAERIIEEAREAARVLRLEAEDYVDAKLANFEIVLNKTLTAVAKGRERLRGRMVTDDLAPGTAGPGAPAGEEAGHRPEASRSGRERERDPYSTGEFVQAGRQVYDHEQGL